jgi:Na+/melibiose symporter-like transporter
LLNTSTRLWYGLGQTAEGIKNHSFTTFLLFYYTQVHGLSGTLASLALGIALLFDAVSDPLAGVLSDRTESRWGRRHPFMYASAVPLGVFVYLLFAPPEIPADLPREPLLLAWLLMSIVGARVSMTFFAIPWGATARQR